MPQRFIVDVWKGFGATGRTTYFVIDTHRFGLQICEGATRSCAQRIATVLSRRGVWRQASARDRRQSLRVRWGKGPWTCRKCKERVRADMFHQCARAHRKGL